MSKHVHRNIGVICRINLTVHQAPGTSSGIGGGGDSAGNGSAGNDGLYRFLTI